jgi:hypothetical protein
MVASTLTALVVALYRPVYFLASVSVFSFYMAFRGYRVLARKRPDLHQRAKVLDWAVTLLTLAGSLMLVVLGIFRTGGLWVTLGPAAIAFGGVGLLLTGMDIREFLYPPRDRHFWWYSHMSGMIGSYIAAVSAFSVTNFHFLPTLVRWLWPTVIGVPLMVLWIRSYATRFASSARLVESPGNATRGTL